MKKQIKKLQNKLGYNLEVCFGNDGNTIVIKSGENRPPEQEEIYKEFPTRSQAKRWLHEKASDDLEE